MENYANDSKEIFKFYYSTSTRRPKKLENNVFIIYSPERIKLQPGERKFIDTQIKLYFSKMSTVLVDYFIHMKIKD